VDKSLLRDLKRIATGQGTIPRPVQHEVEDILGELDEVTSWMLRDDDEDGTNLPNLRRELRLGLSTNPYTSCRAGGRRLFVSKP